MAAQDGLLYRPSSGACGEVLGEIPTGRYEEK